MGRVQKVLPPDATFTAQAEPHLGVWTLADYTNWMKAIMTVLPHAYYAVKSFATDTMRNNVAALRRVPWQPYRRA
jgi:hypothetical protein